METRPPILSPVRALVEIFARLHERVLLLFDPIPSNPLTNFDFTLLASIYEDDDTV